MGLTLIIYYICSTINIKLIGPVQPAGMETAGQSEMDDLDSSPSSVPTTCVTFRKLLKLLEA